MLVLGRVKIRLPLRTRQLVSSIVNAGHATTNWAPCTARWTTYRQRFTQRVLPPERPVVDFQSRCRRYAGYHSDRHTGYVCECVVGIYGTSDACEAPSHGSKNQLLQPVVSDAAVFRLLTWSTTGEAYALEQVDLDYGVDKKQLTDDELVEVITSTTPKPPVPHGVICEGVLALFVDDCLHRFTLR